MARLMGEPLFVDTNDKIFDSYLTGYYKVILGYGEYIVVKVIC